VWLVVGLGNPGKKYEHNRHNIGFLVVDELVRKHGLEPFSAAPSGSSGSAAGEATHGLIVTPSGRERAQVLKPMGFMNLSGYATQRTAAFHKIEVENILVVHDEIDLDFGIVRLKNAGGHGGHNGLRSLIEQLGSNKFARLRMGVGRDPNSQPGAKDAAGWVLKDFPVAQQPALDAMIKAGFEDIETVISKGILAAMNLHNGRSNLATP